MFNATEQRFRIRVKIGDNFRWTYYQFPHHLVFSEKKKVRYIERKKTRSFIASSIAQSIIQLGYRPSSLQVYKRKAVKMQLGGLVSERKYLPQPKKVKIRFETI